MAHSSRLDPKVKAIAEVLAMIGDADPAFVPDRPRPIPRTADWLWDSATEFCAALDRYEARVMKVKKSNQPKRA